MLTSQSKSKSQRKNWVLSQIKIEELILEMRLTWCNSRIEADLLEN